MAITVEYKRDMSNDANNNDEDIVYTTITQNPDISTCTLLLSYIEKPLLRYIINQQINKRLNYKYFCRCGEAYNDSPSLTNHLTEQRELIIEELNKQDEKDGIFNIRRYAREVQANDIMFNTHHMW